MEDNVKSAIDLKGPGSINMKGGFRAAKFIYALVSLDNMGFVANMVSLVTYFTQLLNFSVSGAANTLTNFMGSTFLLAIFGGFISDTYVDRFKATIIFGVFEMFGLALMIIQAYYKKFQPEACGKSSCMHGDNAALLYVALSLYAVGAGGIKASLPTLGADQFDRRNPKEARGLARYFNWLLLVTTWGGVIGVTVIVWVSSNSNNRGWWKGLLITLLGSFLGFVVLTIGKPFYRLQQPGDSPILKIIQVIVVAIKNRKLSAPKNVEELYEINEKESESGKISHTQQFRCLDKAAILPKGTEYGPWKVCTVTQVEEVKVITRMLPIIFSTIIMNTCLAQLQTFSVTQGYFMNRYIGSFQISASSVPVIPLLAMSFLIPVYEYFFVPFARKFTGHPGGITQLQRVGVGLVLSIVSMIVSALVEVKRRNQSLETHMMKPINVFWLSFQYGIFGIADMFTLVGLLEFFYREAPEGMKSLSTSFTWLSMSFGYFLSSIFVDIINSITRRTTHDKQGWLEGQFLDMYSLDLFYWFLAILSGLNFLNYLYWASWYKYKKLESDVNDAGENYSNIKTANAVDASAIEDIGPTKREDANIATEEEVTTVALEGEVSTAEDETSKIATNNVGVTIGNTVDAHEKN